MNWLFMLGAAVVVIAIAAVFGAQPKGGRPVSRTHLMGVARFVLIVVALIIGFIVFRLRGR